MPWGQWFSLQIAPPQQPHLSCAAHYSGKKTLAAFSQAQASFDPRTLFQLRNQKSTAQRLNTSEHTRLAPPYQLPASVPRCTNLETRRMVSDNSPQPRRSRLDDGRDGKDSEREGGSRRSHRDDRRRDDRRDRNSSRDRDQKRNRRSRSPRSPETRRRVSRSRERDRRRRDGDGEHRRRRSPDDDDRGDRRDRDRHRRRDRPTEDGEKSYDSKPDGRALRRGGPLPSQENEFALIKGEEPPKEKEKPNYGMTGALAAASNSVAQADGSSIVLKYHEPPEARKPSPKDQWKLFVFKGQDIIDTIELNARACWLIGREMAVIDIAAEHPSISKQHAVIQFRYLEKRNEYGDKIGKVKPYLIDLDSANGTMLNSKKVPDSRYLELKDKDLIQFGQSTREYVIMLAPRD